MAAIEEFPPLTTEARRILQDGELYEKSVALGCKVVNFHPYAMKVAHELPLVLAGKIMGHAKPPTGTPLRMYHNVLGYGPIGSSKLWAWRTLMGNTTAKPSPLSPYFTMLNTKPGLCSFAYPMEIDSATIPMAIGSVTENSVVPSILGGNDFIVTEEAQTLLGGPRAEADLFAAMIRKIADTGKYTRALKGVSNLADRLEEAELSAEGTEEGSPEARALARLRANIQRAADKGTKLDLERGTITIEVEASLYLASAEWMTSTGALMKFGDFNRYRILSWVPTADQMKDAVLMSGAYPPLDFASGGLADRDALHSAWPQVFRLELERWHNFEIPDSEYYRRKKWIKELLDQVLQQYPDLSKDELAQILNMRTASDEFFRTASQHALLNQFSRAGGVDFNVPSRFVWDDEDFEFALDRSLGEYIPSLLAISRTIKPRFSRGPPSSPPEEETLRILQVVLQEQGAVEIKASAFYPIATTRHPKHLAERMIRLHLARLEAQGKVLRPRHGIITLPPAPKEGSP